MPRVPIGESGVPAGCLSSEKLLDPGLVRALRTPLVSVLRGEPGSSAHGKVFSSGSLWDLSNLRLTFGACAAHPTFAALIRERLGAMQKRLGSIFLAAREAGPRTIGSLFASLGERF